MTFIGQDDHCQVIINNNDDDDEEKPWQPQKIEEPHQAPIRSRLARSRYEEYEALPATPCAILATVVPRFADQLERPRKGHGIFLMFSKMAPSAAMCLTAAQPHAQ